MINEEVILGALHSPNDGTADPSALCSGLTTGALAMGAQVGCYCNMLNIYGPELAENSCKNGQIRLTQLDVYLRQR